MKKKKKKIEGSIFDDLTCYAGHASVFLSNWSVCPRHVGESGVRWTTWNISRIYLPFGFSSCAVLPHGSFSDPRFLPDKFVTVWGRHASLTTLIISARYARDPTSHVLYNFGFDFLSSPRPAPSTEWKLSYFNLEDSLLKVLANLSALGKTSENFLPLYISYIDIYIHM